MASTTSRCSISTPSPRAANAGASHTSKQPFHAPHRTHLQGFQEPDKSPSGITFRVSLPIKRKQKKNQYHFNRYTIWPVYVVRIKKGSCMPILAHRLQQMHLQRYIAPGAFQKNRHHCLTANKSGPLLLFCARPNAAKSAFGPSHQPPTPSCWSGSQRPCL